MASNETKAQLEAMSAALRATTKLTKETDDSEEFTPAMLASAIKLASLSNSHQEQLTSATVNAAIKFVSKIPEQKEESLTPESLACALKLATKASSDKDDSASADQMLAAMKAAIALGQINEEKEFVTPEFLSDALKLAKE